MYPKDNMYTSYKLDIDAEYYEEKNVTLLYGELRHMYEILKNCNHF